MVTLSSLFLRSVMSASALVLLLAGNAAWADPPGRVARMSYIRGDVSFQPGGSGQWVDAVINRPLVTGDRLATDRNARVEIEIGAGSIRLDERSTFSLLDVNDRITQVELTDGTLNIAVRRLIEGQTYEVDTPTLAFVVSQPGEYRIDVAPNGDSTMVTVFRGSGIVYGENNASYRVRNGQSYRFNDSRLRDYRVLNLPRADNFDRFCQERSNRYERSVSSRYVSDEIVGYADLDDYGSWSNVASYGSVWYPRGLRSGWAPYRDGHWAWIDPWGWSWVDDQPWGFAPSHYGRWAYIDTRWGWVPGPRQLRPVYAPALVAFVGGNNWSVSIGSNPVGWFPLGPRDVYRPWYDTSRDYFTRVNTHNTIINNVTVVNIYNDYSRGRPSRGDYAYRRDERAFTAVPGDVFAGAQPVGRSRLRLDQDAIGRGDVVNAVAITPVQASLAARGNGRANRPDPERFDRAVVVRNAPPAEVLPFAEREEIIRENGNRSPGMEKLRERDRSTEATEDRRIRVVDADKRATPREIPVDVNGIESDRVNPNRAERRAEGRAGMAELADREANANADGGQRLDRTEDRERLREKADAREEAGNAEQRLPSTRFSPASRNRSTDGTSREDLVEQGQQSDVRSDQRGRDAKRERADDNEQRSDNEREKAMRDREESARRTGPTATDPPERLQPQEQRQQRDVPAERKADDERGNDMREQRRAQAQEQREQLAEQADRLEAQQVQSNQQAERIQAQEQQRAEQAERAEAKQMERNQQAERIQAQEQQRAEQAERSEAKQMERNQQAERMQAQEQERAEQANRNQAQQIQRQQEQQERQARMEERQQEDQSRQVQQQAQIQERQQQAEQMQMQRQQQAEQMQQQLQQQQMQQQQQQQQMQQQQQQQQMQQQQQQQPPPPAAQEQRELRKEQKREEREAKEEQQDQ